MSFRLRSEATARQAAFAKGLNHPPFAAPKHRGGRSAKCQRTGAGAPYKSHVTILGWERKYKYAIICNASVTDGRDGSPSRPRLHPAADASAWRPYRNREKLLMTHLTASRRGVESAEMGIEICDASHCETSTFSCFKKTKSVLPPRPSLPTEAWRRRVRLCANLSSRKRKSHGSPNGSNPARPYSIGRTYCLTPLNGNVRNRPLYGVVGPLGVGPTQG